MREETALPLSKPQRTFEAPPSRHRLARYGPLVIWAFLIFVGSTSVLSAANTSVLETFFHWIFPSASRSTLKTFHFLVRKTGHFSEYAMFAAFAARAFRTSSRDLLKRRWFLIALLAVLVYALGDEYHQSFVPSRTASIYDSLIDTFGGLCALIVVGLAKPKSVRRT